MDVLRLPLFIGWSGHKGRLLAEELRSWLRGVIPVEPYVSSVDIKLGASWSQELSNKLGTSSFGLFCVTPDSLHAPWIMFEAGAISKLFDGKVVPILFWSVHPYQLKDSPLGLFQGIEFKKDKCKDLVLQILKHCADPKPPEYQITDTFNTQWGALCGKVDTIEDMNVDSDNSYVYRERFSVSDLCHVTEQQVIKCIENRMLTQDAMLAIGLAALRRHFGEFGKEEDSYLDFLFEVLVNRTTIDEPFVIRDYREIVRVDLLDAGCDVFSKNYLRRCIESDVQLHRARSNVEVYPLDVSMECMLDREYTEAFLRKTRYIIRWNGTPIFDWQKVVANGTLEELKKRAEIQLTDCVVRFNAETFSIDVRKDVPVLKNHNKLTISEESFIRYDDNSYKVSVRYPTKQLYISARLGRGLEWWSMKPPSVGPSMYYPADVQLKPITQPKEVSINIPTWILPGIACVLEWMPGNRPGEEKAHPVFESAFRRESGDLILGQTGPFKGPASAIGLALRNGARAFFEQQNTKSHGINGRQVQLKSFNDYYEPRQSLAGVEQLIPDAFCFFGCVGTPTSKAIQPVITGKHIPFFAPFTGAKFLRRNHSVTSDKHYIVNVRSGYDKEVNALVEHVRKKGIDHISEADRKLN